MTPDERARRLRDKWSRQKRGQRKPDKPGKKLIQVRIEDEEACRLLLEAPAGWSLAAAVEFHINDQCRDFRRKQREEEWERILRIRVGALDREPAPDPGAVIAEGPNVPAAPTFGEPTEAQEELTEELGDAWWQDEHWWEREDDPPPEAGKSGRVKTRHNVEQDK